MERRRRRQRHARADGFGRGGAATAWAAAALSARACRLPSLCAARERSGAQGSVAARGNAAVVAAAAAAAARAGGLIRTGRSDRLGGRRRSRRKLSIYVQKPLGRVVAQFAPVKRMAVFAPAEGLHGPHRRIRARYSDFAICSCGGVSQICQWYRVCDAGALRAEPLATLYLARSKRISKSRFPGGAHATKSQERCRRAGDKPSKE